MGDRALVVFKQQHDNGPAVYLHWAGSEVLDLLRETKELMAGRNDVDYVTARFIGIAHVKNPGNLSLGVSNCDSVEHAFRQDPGDNGVFVVDVDTWQVESGNVGIIEL